MLKSVNKFSNALLVSNWKIALIFWFSFQGTLHGQGPKATGRMGRLVFIFLFFFVNRLVDCFFCTVFTIIIIKCKVSFSCHSSSYHYSTQGFVLILFHFIFSFLKNKKVNIMQFHMWPSVLFTDIRLKMQTGKKLPSEWVLERKHFHFFDCTFLL